MNSVRPWYYNYVLISMKTNEFYTGVTSDVKKRLVEHNNGLVTSTRYKRPLKLIYLEACLNKNDAFRREKYQVWAKDILSNV